MAWTGMQGNGGQEGADGGPIALAEGSGRPRPHVERDERPTLLVAAPQGRAAELAGWGTRAGFRCIGTVEPGGIAERLAMTVAVDLILADLRGIALSGENARALAARHGLPDARLAILSDMNGLDATFAWADGPDADIVCEPEAGEIFNLLAAAAIAAERRRCPPQFHDNGRDADRNEEAARIERLSDEVRRLSTMVERLTRAPEASAGAEPAAEAPSPYRMGVTIEERPAPRGVTTIAAAPTHGEIKALLRARRLREQYLPADLFADPAWDMILDLMAARLAGQRVSVSSLCIAAAVPPTTALRWIRQLTERGVFSRIDDPADGRRVFIELTDGAAEAVMAWSIAVRRNGGLLPPA